MSRRPEALEKTDEKRKNAVRNPFGISTFRKASTTRLTIGITFNKMQKNSVASLRGLIRSSRNIDRHQSGMLIAFTGIQTCIPLKKQQGVDLPRSLHLIHAIDSLILSLKHKRQALRAGGDSKS
jgi:hypothetical protein